VDGFWFGLGFFFLVWLVGFCCVFWGFCLGLGGVVELVLLWGVFLGGLLVFFFVGFFFLLFFCSFFSLDCFLVVVSV